ncbi:MAG: hypothetical protein Q8R30_02605 [bacterium]|nr:hypothetical protein [bacterium]
MDTNTTISDSMNAAPRFRGQVLNRIYRVWLFRKFLPVLLIEVAVFSIVLYGLAKVIFFQRIAENAMNVFFQNPSHIFSFFVWAFVDARFGIKILVVAIVVAIALVIHQITQGLLRYILIRQNYFAKVNQGSK